LKKEVADIHVLMFAADPGKKADVHRNFWLDVKKFEMTKDTGPR
jgi:hypothetical protein